jgi:RNA polymerase sigma-70 factor (ECF subfamily)
MLSTEVQERIASAMSALSAMERAAFTLRHFEGRSIDEISLSLGLKTNATKHSIFRAVRKMRSALEPLVDFGTQRTLGPTGAGRASQ